MAKADAPGSSIHAFDFVQQLLLQISPRSLFDRAPLRGYCFLLSFTLLSCSRLHRLRHVPDLRPLRTGFSLFWFRVRIHGKLAPPIGDKNNWNCGELQNRRKQRHGHD
jgi:hypothetical protein